MNCSQKGLTRREWMQRSGVGALGLTVLAREVLGASGGVSPNQKPIVAGVGVGGVGFPQLEACERAGFEIGVLYGAVQPGDTVAIIGAGPIGMAALLTAQFFSPARLIMVDVDDSRLAMAKTFGATDVINSASTDAVAGLMAMTKDGIDVVIEAVGIAATFDICQSVVRPGGHIANIGVHGTSVDLQLQDLWIKNITLTTGLVNTNTTDMLMKNVQSGKLKPAELITHRFPFADFMRAYEVFANASKEKALKVIIDNS